VWQVDDKQPRLKTVLLVGDDLAADLHLSEMLAQQVDYQVLVASDWVTATKFLRVCTPNLILLDEHLLTRHGIDLLPRLQVMKDLQDIPLLFLSTASPGSKQEDLTPS
jgi:response regulator RpfG family c-di-GMP phosphodiesterase